MNPFGMSWAIDGWIIATGVLASVAAALLGNFLVLRRMSMLGDAISHAVLPGLAAAFFLTGSRHSLPMFLGAVAVGVLTALFTEWIHRYGSVDEGASMGVVFTSLFAAGLLMIVRAADSVDLDPGCVLYGAIEMTPLSTWTVAGVAAPRVVFVLGAVLILNAAAVALLFKEFRVSAFDPSLATTVGVNAQGMHYLLMTLVAVTAVAAFEAVGNILVVAMFVAPPATAFLLTKRLGQMVWLSAAIAAVGAVLGHLGVVLLPRLAGFSSTNTAGGIAVASGVLFAAAVVLSPSQGLIARALRRRAVWLATVAEDILGVLYRHEEGGRQPAIGVAELADRVGVDPRTLRRSAKRLATDGLIDPTPHGYRLTDAGVVAAREVVRSHRLWETYLVSEAGMDSAAIHPRAEELEHVTDRRLRGLLRDATAEAPIDPHGKPIPAEPDEPAG
ncbi:MAG: metal ABC transporter permease [Planctomycetota bacterium]